MTLDLTEMNAPKSDQMNAEDLLPGPRTFTIAEVRKAQSAEQPFEVVLAEFPAGRPFKPSKTVRRILVAAWGKDAAVYVGRRMTLFRDPEVTFGRDKPGGIRVSHLSHITEPTTVWLTVTRGKRAPFTVEPLPDDAPTSPPQPTDQIPQMLAAYERAGVTKAMLEAREARPVDEWDAGNVANLTALFEALKSGELKKADEFPALADAQPTDQAAPKGGA